jgi:hypothetical protein
VTDRFDRLLRSTLAELTTEARPVPLLEATRRKARVIRRRRIALGVGAAVVTLFTAIALPGLAGRPDAYPPGRDPVPSASPSTAEPRKTPSADLPAEAVRGGGLDYVIAAVSPAGASALSYVWNRQRQRYDAMAVDAIRPAPAGTLVLLKRHDQLKLLDLKDNSERDIIIDTSPLGDGMPQWSPDGTKLAYAAFEKATGALHLRVIDAATGKDTVLRAIDRGGPRCGDFCNVTWHPNGQELLMSVTDDSVPHDEGLADVQLGLQGYSVTSGEPTRLIPVRGAVAGAQAWGSTARWLIVLGTTADRRPDSQIVEVATGRVTYSFGDDTVYRTAHGIGPGNFLVQVNGTVQNVGENGSALTTVAMPDVFADRLLYFGKK